MDRNYLVVCYQALLDTTDPRERVSVDTGQPGRAEMNDALSLTEAERVARTWVEHGERLGVKRTAVVAQLVAVVP